MTRIVQLDGRAMFRARLQQSVHRLRMEAALNLAAHGTYAGGRIINACKRVHASYSANCLPDAADITAIRQAIRELQDLVATYGAAGVETDPTATALTHGA